MRSTPLKEEISTLIALQEFDSSLSNIDHNIEEKKQELTEREH